jgi:hypothetical protein
MTFKIEYLCEFLATFENIFICMYDINQGAMRKRTKGKKSRSSVPLKQVSFASYINIFSPPAAPFLNEKSKAFLAGVGGGVGWGGVV